ncbi:MAG: PQQ-binding-like beta-propeller repeat protein [Phycisphaerales bacterium]|jgi:outer membrane protein assembly factor BamB|nr:PQQ-binding-like beta-propeller repeat protein [Phycisphaerales bacterium]
MSATNNKTAQWRLASIMTMAVAGAFILFVVIVMARAWKANITSNPTDHPRIEKLRDDLAADSGSEKIITELRNEDLALRKEFFRTWKILSNGVWLLLGGACVLAASLTIAISTSKKTPMPIGKSKGPNDMLAGLLGRVGIALAAIALTGAALTIPILTREVSTRAQAKGIWPGFRGGPEASGISPYTDVPISFDGITGQNIAWKVRVPLNGQSSPAIWDNSVFITGANKQTRKVYCFDALSGRITWDKSITAGPGSTKVPEGVMEDDTTYAAPTPIIDVENNRIFVMFANGDVACLDTFGKIIWQKHLGTPDNFYGHAASPVLWKKNLIIQLDQGEPDDKLSALIGLNADNGEELWRTTRPVGSSWPTPIIAPVESGDQLITCANPFAISYDPATGKEIWRVDCLDGDGGPSPIYAAGLVFAVNVSSKIAAIDPSGKGDVTKTHVKWEFDEDLPDTCSPLSDGKLLWMMAEGEFSCMDVATGKRLWNKNFESSFYASPVLVGDRIYLINRKGKVYVISAGRELEELGKADLGEACDASPAFAEGRMYIRGKKHLYCIEEQNK